MRKLLLVTGEASGDIHGANLARALRQLDPSVRLFGVGGGKMLDAGVSLLPHVERVDAIGVPGIQQLLKGWKTLRTLSRYVRQEQFNAIILIDSPGLNLRLAKVAIKASPNIIYYIAPQVWAWGSRRLHLIRKVVTRILAILPFEEAYFRNAGISCHYVGHPILDDLQSSYDKIRERKRLGLKEEGVVIGLLPGSREGEVRKILPSCLKAVNQIQNRLSMVQVIIAQSPSLTDSLIRGLLGQSENTIRVVKGQANEVMAAADLLLVTSGTATLQGALIGTPMIVVYRVSSLTYQIAKHLVTIPHIGLVNILAGKEVVPELLQDRMTPEGIFTVAMDIIEDSNRQNSMKQEFLAIRQLLGDPGASRRAAEMILADITT